MAKIWTYRDHPDGIYVINLDTNTFIEEPQGNVLTVAEIRTYSQNNQTTPTLVDNTTEAFSLDQAQRQLVNLTDSNEVLGESMHAFVGKTNGGAQQTGISDTYVKITQFNSIKFQKNVSIADNAITVLKAGVISITSFPSFSGSNGKTYEIAIHVNGVEELDSRSQTSLDVANQVQAGACTTYLAVSVNSVIDIRVRTTTSGSSNFKLLCGNLALKKIR